MKRALTIGLTSVAIAATLSIVTAWSRSPEPVAAADALPAYEIVTRATELGLEPISQPQRRGPYYVLHAQDPRGREMRIVADAQSGDIVSAAPVRPANVAYGSPRLSSAPRIIHVPQPGDDTRASLPDRAEPAVAPDDDEEEAAPPPRVRQVMPHPQRQSDAPQEPRRKPYAKTTTPQVRPAPPPVERRTVLRAPPSQHDGPSPIRPTPRFSAKAESGEKFPPPPPPGYTPPANLPQSDAPPADAPKTDAPQTDAAQGD